MRAFSFSFGDYYCNDVPCAGRKPLREVTQLLRRMFLSTPAPVTTWAGESTFGDGEVIIDVVAKVR